MIPAIELMIRVRRERARRRRPARLERSQERDERKARAPRGDGGSRPRQIRRSGDQASPLEPRRPAAAPRHVLPLDAAPSRARGARPDRPGAGGGPGPARTGGGRGDPEPGRRGRDRRGRAVLGSGAAGRTVPRTRRTQDAPRAAGAMAQLTAASPERATEKGATMTPTTYEVRISGLLPDDAFAELQDVRVTTTGVSTVLSGVVTDQWPCWACSRGCGPWAWTWWRCVGCSPRRHPPAPGDQAPEPPRSSAADDAAGQDEG